MSFNDLKIFPKISHLRETMRGGLNYVEFPQKLILILNSCIMLSRNDSYSSRPENKPGMIAQNGTFL